MQDVFIEYMVKRRRTARTTLTKLGLGFCGVVLGLVAFSVSPLLGPFSFVGILLAFGAVYGAYILITNLNVEYEYSLTNGDMDVDKIIAQRKRKRLISIRCREAEDFGKYKASEHADKQYQTRIMACDDPAGEDLWFFSLRHKDKGLTLIVFNTSERMLEGIKPFLPRPVFHKAFRIGA